MRSNPSRAQRRSMISDMDARIAIYDRSETQVFFPSRKYAEDVFYSIEFQQPPDWSINPEIALRGSEPGYRSGRSTSAIVKRITKWAEENPTRFKFKIERSYLLNQYVGGQGSGNKCVPKPCVAETRPMFLRRIHCLSSDKRPVCRIMVVVRYIRFSSIFRRHLVSYLSLNAAYF